jgi:hypothetical protein
MNATTRDEVSASERELQLLCAIARGQAEIGEKLDDLKTLAQQQVDLLRRIISEERAPRAGRSRCSLQS